VQSAKILSESAMSSRVKFLPGRIMPINERTIPDVDIRTLASVNRLKSIGAELRIALPTNA
jgi:hypothetical protein